MVVTSPIKGYYATLKRYLQRGNGDLKKVYDNLSLFWTNQHSVIVDTAAQQQLRPRHSIRIPLFAAVRQHVHTFALLKIVQEQAKLPAKGELGLSCAYTIQQTMGLPCYHTIWERTRGNRVILLEDIHPY